MSITRTISEGPAVIEFNGYKYYTEGTITLTPELATREMVASMYGVVDRRITDKVFNISFTPFGMLDDMSAYFPFTNSDIGKLLAPAVDTPLIIWAASGQKLSFPAGCITGCPQLLLGTDKGPCGSMSIAGMGNLTKADAAADAHYTITQATIAAHTFDPASAPTPAYKCTIGSTALDAEEGFSFDLRAEITPRKVNRHGTVNYRLSGLSPSVSFIPFGLSESAALDLLLIQGAKGVPLGSSNRLGQKMTIEPAAGLGVTIEFEDCQISNSNLLYGKDDPRYGEWVITPALSFSSGTPQPLYTITGPTFPTPEE